MLGVDTDVALDGRLLGKAADEAGARERLEALSGRTHEVLSGRRRPRPRASRWSSAAASRAREVSFARARARPTIDLYLASGEWRDRAGAYAIQGLGSILIERIARRFLQRRRTVRSRCCCNWRPNLPRNRSENPKANI